MKKMKTYTRLILFHITIVFNLSNLAFTQEVTNLKLIPSSVAFTIGEKDLFPEGITYDSKTKQFFLSSIQKEKILAINEAGKEYEFIQAKQDGMLRSLGMKVDEKRRRLWVVSNSDWDDTAVSAVHIFDVDNRKLIKSFFTESGKTPLFNDLILAKNGDAYISDYGGNSIYQIPSDLSKLELFLKSDSLLAGANGLTISPDNSFLYVASYSKGIVLVDLNSKFIKPIENQISAESRGIDGLMLYKKNLVAILNGESDISKHHIARYQLSPDGRDIVSVNIIDLNNPLFNEPTTGVIVGDDLYCLAATYLRQFAIGKAYDYKQLKNPLILKYHLQNN